MAAKPTDKMTCSWRCGWHGIRADTIECDIVRKDNGEVIDSVLLCPKCCNHEGLERACDEPGCFEAATCGAPTPSGYRHTCYNHAPNYPVKE